MTLRRTARPTGGTDTIADREPGPATGGWWARLRADPLLHHADFNRLWAGQAISQLGSQVSMIALPLIAISTLHVGASGMGVMNALGRLPFLLYLFAGVFVDRSRRRRSILIGTDLARGVIVIFLCVTALTGVLSLWLICAALLVSMSLSVWFDIGYMSYLPGLVGRMELMNGNVRLETTRATAQVAGPSIGGALIQAVSAPLAILLDALSFLASALFVWRIRTPEPARDTGTGQRRGPRGVAADLAVGLRFVARDRVLRPLAAAIAFMNLVWAAELALYLLFMARGLHMSAGLIGLTLAGEGPGALIGSMLAGRVARRFGLSGAVVGGLGVFALAALAVPAAPSALVVAVPVLVVSGFLMALGGQVCAVNVLTTRQLLTPDALQGRVNASFRFLGLGISPLGALAGGYLGQALGLRPALYIAIAGMFVAPLIVAISPVRRIRDIASLTPHEPGDATSPTSQEGHDASPMPQDPGRTEPPEGAQP